MTSRNDFDAERDPMLGAQLRALLDAGDPAPFRAAVLGRLDQRDASSWDVLADWARPGIAAAILLATLAGAVYAIQAARNSSAPSTVLAEAIERDQVVGVVLGASR